MSRKGKKKKKRRKGEEESEEEDIPAVLAVSNVEEMPEVKHEKMLNLRTQNKNIAVITLKVEQEERYALLHTQCGADCSKLMRLLVNVMLKFQMLILQIHYFCWKNVRIFCNAKDSHIFSTKYNSVFAYVVSIY